jgi:hypothetical protein
MEQTGCNYANSYSKDGAHPTDLSMSIMGSIEAADVQPLLWIRVRQIQSFSELPRRATGGRPDRAATH